MASPSFANAPDFDNLMSPVNIQNPFPLYAWLRENSPVHWSKVVNGWLLTRYADVRNAMGNTSRLSSQSGLPLLEKAKSLPAEARADFELGYRFFYRQIQSLDAPVHTLQRSLITKAFSARVMETMRERIQTRVDSLIDAMERKQSCDFVAEFAYPLPSLVIFDLLGVPEECYPALRQSAHIFARFPVAASTSDLPMLRQVSDSLRETEVLLRELVALRRKEPRLDLISSLAAVREGPSQLSDEEIVVLCNFLLFAGHETTANLLAGSVLHLLKEQQRWDALRGDLNSIPSSIEELLRFVSPVLALARSANDELELHGTTIKKGERVILGVGAANHDPAQYENAEDLMLDRPRFQSIAFGHGVHFCIGALLARTETEIALRTLLTRLPEMQLAVADVEYQPVYFLRSVKALPVKIWPGY